ncbi:MAG: DUF4872 domain-containing protein [Balneolaceae bacterium]|nr:DUF4872 domain-containing protein [Balneolaceae bacterium]
MIIKDFSPFIGQHCETTAIGSLLKQMGIDLSEPMLFGIGEGFGYIYWNMKTMDFPFIGGRVKPDVLTENICRNLDLHLEIKETSSIKKAWKNVTQYLDNGQAVGLKLDCYHLDYFTNKIHFAGHYVALYGYDEEFAYLIDTDQQGRKVQTTLKSLELARNEKGPMSSRNRSYTIEQVEELSDLNRIIKQAIFNNATEYLNPPIKNISYKGIKKTSVEIINWFKTSQDIKGEFQASASIMEKAGTGGALFRNLYRDFLKESADKLESPKIKEAHEDFIEIASLWTKVSKLFHKIGETKDEKYLNRTSEILIDISEKEKRTMEKLKEACA